MNAKSHNTAPGREAVMQALQAVNDPELHRSIVDLGMVEGVTLEGGTVRLTVNLTTPACPLRGQIEKEVTAALQAVPGVTEVRLTMGAKTVRSLPEGDELIPGVRNTILVGSGKGGVGKSTVAANLALALAQLGASVGLLDADVYGPNQPLMLGTQATAAHDGKKLRPVEVKGIKLISMAMFIKRDEPVVWRGPMLHGVIKQFLGDVEWGDLDYLIVDLPPGTGDVQLTLSQLIPPTGYVLVTTPQEVALLDARRAANMFAKVRVPALGVVENMAGFDCPHCAHHTDLFGAGGGRRIAEELGVPLLGSIPIDPLIMAGSDTGDPIVLQKGAPEAVRRAYVEAAAQLAARISVMTLQGAGAPERTGQTA